MKNPTTGNVPKTIDSNGNVIDKPYGVSRWASPRIRDCAHDDCTNPALILRASDTLDKAHNCCTQH